MCPPKKLEKLMHQNNLLLETKLIDLISKIITAMLVFIFAIFFYHGLTHLTPTSPDYNIPIANSIISGDFLKYRLDDPYIYSPGATNLILVIFILLKIPLNLFGLLGWVFLLSVCYFLAKNFGFDKLISVIFAGSVVGVVSIVRTIPDQSIDKWLCAWFILCLLTLQKPRTSWAFSLIFGFSLGMLIGTKYSGPLFAIPLVLIYFKSIIKNYNLIRFLVSIALVFVFGIFWYLRNLIIMGSPIYPAGILGFKGLDGFVQQDWMLWKIPFDYPQGIIPLINSFISEYMVWSFSLILFLGIIIYFKHKKRSIKFLDHKLIILTISTLLVSLFLPITPAYEIELFHIISDMRYIYIPVVLLMLEVFLFFNKYNKNLLISFIALVNIIPVFSFIQYNPKVFLFSILICVIFFRNYISSLRKSQ